MSGLRAMLRNRLSKAARGHATEKKQPRHSRAAAESGECPDVAVSSATPAVRESRFSRPPRAEAVAQQHAHMRGSPYISLVKPLELA